MSLPSKRSGVGVIMPWDHIKKWNPIRVDALGLVTLLGDEEVDRAIGTLQKRRLTEYLPLLGDFVIAGDRFTSAQSGFTLYNVTDGITTA
ncbi:hypothetical protein H2203_005379 [Taxawa tesnikishii (nom. ined.)]|nr:hypothetical protein H2203_005379 [Dothideales sp. JES 119]